jgi:hypothetical protein
MHRFALLSTCLCFGLLPWLGACSDDDGTQDAGDVEDVPDAADADVPTEAEADAADTADTADVPDAVDVEPETDAACPDCGMIRIYVAGDDTPKTFTDSMSGQTPFDYFIGVSNYQVLRSASDPSPVPCFDYGADTFSIDLQADNLVGRCATAAFPLGTYTHGRTKVDWITYKVVGDVHYAGATLPATFQIFKAFSTCDYDGHHYTAGEGWIGYDVSGYVGQIPYAFPELAALGGVSFVTEGDSFWVVFPFTHPFVIGESDSAEHWSRMFWEIFESFRWTDIRLTGYAAGRWDVAPAGETEAPGMFGVSGYHIESSTD